MRKSTLLTSFLLALFTNVSATPDSLNTCPFERAVLAARDFNDGPYLDRRQNNGCAANLQSCSSLSRAGSGSACCASNAICTLDNAGNVACCPAGSFCTGTLSLPTTTSKAIAGITATPVVTGAVTTYTPGQYISNSFFAFPVLWLSNAQFADASYCASAYATCDSYYNSCTAALQSSIAGYGVTVSAPGGGYTVAGGVATALGLESATSVCRSLSAIGCPGQSATCSGAAGTAAATGFVIVTPSSGVKKSRGIKGGSAAALVAIVAWAVVAW